MLGVFSLHVFFPLSSHFLIFSLCLLFSFFETEDENQIDGICL